MHDIRGMFFRQVFLLDDVMEKLSTLAVLQYQETDIVPLPNFVKLDDIWMIECLQYFDFINEGLKIFKLLLLDGLNGELLASFPILGLVNYTETTGC